jgi:hypothetical protein
MNASSPSNGGCVIRGGIDNNAVHWEVRMPDYYSSGGDFAIDGNNAGTMFRALTITRQGADAGRVTVGNLTCASITVTSGGGSGLSTATGYQQRSGIAGSAQSSYFNMYNAGAAFHYYQDNTDYGAIFMSSDYRIKKDVGALPSMWDRVKDMRPISYRHNGEYGFTDDGVLRWVFIAHELQEVLIDSASNGSKDEENVIQAPNPLTIIAVLTKALQEAMERIEALENAARA